MSFITKRSTRGASREHRSNAWRRLLSTEAKLLLREPMLIFWAVAFPLILTIAMGLAGDRHDKQLGGLSLVDVYVPISMAMVITILALTAVPVVLPATARREYRAGCPPRRCAQRRCSRRTRRSTSRRWWSRWS